MRTKLIHQDWEKFISEECLEIAHKWLGDTCTVRVVPPRKIKLGDYRFKSGKHQITLNSDLSEWLFFYVLSHEIAHLHQHQKYGFGVKPHGSEWKTCFAKLLLESVHLYPENIRPYILKDALHPRATTCGIPTLYSLLCGQNKRVDFHFLKEISEGSYFTISNKTFIKGIRKRTRYLCKNPANGKAYIVSGDALVKIVPSESFA